MEKEIIEYFEPYFIPAELTEIANIKVTVGDWRNKGKVSVEDWQLIKKDARLVAIQRVYNNNLLIYNIGPMLRSWRGLFFWYHPEDEPCERIRLEFVKDNDTDDYYFIGEIWIHAGVGPCTLESYGINAMTFKWP